MFCKGFYDVSWCGGYAAEELGQFHSETGWASGGAVRGEVSRSIANLLRNYYGQSLDGNWIN